LRSATTEKLEPCSATSTTDPTCKFYLSSIFSMLWQE
jgi:hypothetical protein